MEKNAKNAKKNSKNKKVKGFQMNRKTGHVSYAFSQKKQNVESLGFTHNKNDKAPKVRLQHNINPDDTQDCFVKTTVERQKSNQYKANSKYSKYRIHEDDKTLIEIIIQTDKNEQGGLQRKKRR